MKRLKLFQKNFLYTFTLILLIVLLIHGLIYTMIPKVYLNNKHKELSKLTQQLSDHLEGQDESYVLDFTQKFAYASNANINMSLNHQNFTFFGLMKFDIQLSDELTIEEIQTIQKELFVEAPGVLDKVGVILAHQNFTSRNGLPAKVQVMMSVQPVHEIKAVTIKLLPYSLFLSLLIAALSAYFYSKKMTEPVTELLEITDSMAKFDREACFVSDSEDEISQLGLNINKMYAALLKSIDTLQNNINEMEKLEQEKEVFFKAASHELRTPLTSLSVLLENMSLNVGVYQDHETYLKKALDLVEMSNVKLKQILDVSSFENFDDDSFCEIDVLQQIKETLKQHHYLIKEKDLKVDFVTEQPVFINSNVRLLNQILSNLIINAIQYSDTSKTIHIILNKEGFSIENEYKDAHTLDTRALYEPFYRHDSSKTSDTNGNGLGLYIVKRNCELLNYDFELEAFNDIFKFNLYF